MSFHDFDLHPALLRAIDDLGFTEPTPIQKKALPAGLAGRDVLACAMTGSGKTAAFLLPILQRLGAHATDGRGGGSHRGQGHRGQGRRGTSSGQGPRALILTPTRELALQVQESCNELGRHSRVRSATIMGGVGAAPQIKALRSGVEVIVATPGRLLDLMGQGHAHFDRLEVLVLDEADRMLDMGFLPDVRRIVGAVPEERQTLLVSATLPAPIVQLSRTLLNDPVRIDVERPSAPASGVSHEVMPVSQKAKPRLLIELLQRGDIETALVFTRTKHRANRLTQRLEKAGIAAGRIHGNRSQKQRQLALRQFKSGRVAVLVATDIASRGIDIEDLPHVVNFDMPGQPEDYIHRVGRTARAQQTGHAVTFAAPDESRQLGAIERAVGERLPRRHLEGFDYGSPAEQEDSRSRSGRSQGNHSHRRRGGGARRRSRSKGQASSRGR